MASQILPSQRTQGDGMEKIEQEENSSASRSSIGIKPQDSKVEKLSIILHKTSIHKSAPKNLGFAIKLTPQSFDKKKKNLLGNLKSKEPKFVPYEPYKAAVRPIVPPKKKFGLQYDSKKAKDPNTASNISKFSILKEGNKIEESSTKDIVDEKIWEDKIKSLETEIQTLREENKEMENQLKFQVQVNGELKNLLVAAIGEDMETKVHILTEDKLSLAQALLTSAKSLNNHQEQTEWLTGQCEVWKSKFLASSVMIEELARWKASLCQKVNETQDVLKKFIEEVNFIREYVIKTHKNLCKLRDSFDVSNKKQVMESCTLTDFSAENFKLSEILLSRLLGPENTNSTSTIYLNYWKQSAIEKLAEKVLANSNALQFMRDPDVACNALVGAAIDISGKLYLQSHPPKIECCPKCNGEIKLI